MDSSKAIKMGMLNRGKEMMVFDWLKAARIIKERKPKKVMAGLRDDWEYTGGMIYEDGHVPLPDDLMYLASTWAVPELNVDGDIVECYIMKSQTNWDAETYWPEEALDVLKGE